LECKVNKPKFLVCLYLTNYPRSNLCKQGKSCTQNVRPICTKKYKGPIWNTVSKDVRNGREKKNQQRFECDQWQDDFFYQKQSDCFNRKAAWIYFFLRVRSLPQQRNERNFPLQSFERRLSSTQNRQHEFDRRSQSQPRKNFTIHVPCLWKPGNYSNANSSNSRESWKVTNSKGNCC